MRLHEISTRKGYTALVLSDQSRGELASMFPPKYPEFIGHHITLEFGVSEDSLHNMDQENNAKVIGHADDGDSIEALVVSVNGTHERPDGKVYHVTWSLDRDKGRKPVHSNKLIQENGYETVSHVSINTSVKFIPF